MTEKVITQAQLDDLTQHILQVVDMARALSRESRRVKGRLFSCGLGFPKVVYMLMDDLDITLDRLGVAMDIPHIKPTNETPSPVGQPLRPEARQDANDESAGQGVGNSDLNHGGGGEAEQPGAPT